MISPVRFLSLRLLIFSGMPVASAFATPEADVVAPDVAAPDVAAPDVATAAVFTADEEDDAYTSATPGADKVVEACVVTNSLVKELALVAGVERALSGVHVAVDVFPIVSAKIVVFVVVADRDVVEDNLVEFEDNVRV